MCETKTLLYGLLILAALLIGVGVATSSDIETCVARGNSKNACYQAIAR